MSQFSLFALFLVLSTNIVFSQGSALANQDESPDESISNSEKQYEYVLLATNKTSTMQKEMAEAGDSGYRVVAVMGGDTSFGGSEVVEYIGQTVFQTTFGGKETVIILERNRNDTSTFRYEYKLLATKKTSTMQKELLEGGDAGFELVGLTVGSTAFGGDELVSILRRRVD